MSSSSRRCFTISNGVSSNISISSCNCGSCITSIGNSYSNIISSSSLFTYLTKMNSFIDMYAFSTIL